MKDEIIELMISYEHTLELSSACVRLYVVLYFYVNVIKYT